jgi:hypothetical protein
MKGALLTILLILTPIILFAQSDKWQYSVESQTVAAPGSKMPLWFRADKFGSIPLDGISEGLIAGAFKSYDTTRHKFINWSSGFQIRTNIGNTFNLKLLEAYIRLKKGIVQLTVGRTKDIYGITDTALSSGSFVISGNALGIPKIELAVPQYKTFPFFGGFVSGKISVSLGYVGEVKTARYLNDSITNAYIVQNSGYLRLGKPNSKLKLYGGITHHVMFGNEREVFGPGFTLSPFKTLVYAAIGKTFIPLDLKRDSNLRSKVGNHIGTIDLSFQYDFKRVRLLAYRQNLYETGAIAHLANIKDGINGLSLTNKYFDMQKNNWAKIVFEFIYTVDQAGYKNSIRTQSGDEDYYNNGEYIEGWTYHQINLGNPLLTTRQYTRSDLVIYPEDYFINNRVAAFYIGIMGAFNKLLYTVRMDYSKNYGTFGTSIEGHSTGDYFFQKNPTPFNEVNQFSGYIELNKNLKNAVNVGIAIGADYGKLYYNSTGVILKLKKTFN